MDRDDERANWKHPSLFDTELASAWRPPVEPRMRPPMLQPAARPLVSHGTGPATSQLPSAGIAASRAFMTISVVSEPAPFSGAG